ncbi:MAG: MBL fold metallo-hydrolase [Pseudomonadota bacterium]|uniref:MBL fold metallo-hydrolase n=1 Tax=Alcanivorax sp. TaxID=1872427 RepID=UPI00243D0C5C|nr:MBL fold metallo-hydrolase [Alcanivorax sp.]MED5238468.1 MBL fold metallo-hydrolase [Pseudomonadota bacterium]MEE3319639.1 MBL fold metallo-hydrolase [Pseudomonadota bacterium]
MKAVRWILGAVLLLLITITATLQLSPNLGSWPLAPQPPTPGEVTITYLGTSTILISDGETQILTDGYFSRVSIPELFTRIEPDQARIESALNKAGIDKLDAIPVLHSHFDHAMDSGIVARMTDAQLLGSTSSAMAARGSDLDEKRITTVQTHHPYQFGEFTLYFVPADHVPLPRPIEKWTGKGEITAPVKPPAYLGAWQEGGCYGLVIKHPSGSLLIQGSAGMQPGELDRYQADYALLASASLGKQSEYYQQVFYDETVGAVGAHTIIPVHWDNFFVELTEDVKPLPWLLDNLDKSFDALANRHNGDFVVLKPFQRLTLTPPESVDLPVDTEASPPAG